MAKYWNKTEAWLHDAKGIAFDGCHKIYVLMDDQQMAEMKEYGYDPLLSAQDLTVDAMLSTLKGWYEKSCGLRFINAVSTDSEDPNAGFVDLIPQGAEE
jgi:hypothetical protein